jgi:hypothetical protein
MANEGVSSSNATAARRGGNVSIIRQGQTSGYLGNDPYVKEGGQASKVQDLKP